LHAIVRASVSRGQTFQTGIQKLMSYQTEDQTSFKRSFAIQNTTLLRYI